MSSHPPLPDGSLPHDRAPARERRFGIDRRRRFWFSILYGGLRPRRRRPARRGSDARFQALDWHGAHLWAASIGILTLNVVDAFLTVRLLSGGAVELNPVMALFVGGNVMLFAGVKMAITGVCVGLLVLLAGYRFMRVVRVDVILYCVLLAYGVLIAHEMHMLGQMTDVLMP